MEKKTFLICLWPVCQDQKSKEYLELLLSQYHFVCIDRCEKIYSYNRFWVLIADLYQKESWAHPTEGIGVLRKSLWCYQKHSPTTMILIEGASSEKLLELKEEFRKYSGKQKHSLHTIEDPVQAIQVWERYTSGRDFPFIRHSPLWYLYKFFMQIIIFVKRRLHFIDE